VFVCVKDSRSIYQQQTTPVGLHLKIAKLSHRQLSTHVANNSHSDSAFRNEVSSGHEKSAEKNSSLPGQVTGDGTAGIVQEKHAVCKEGSMDQAISSVLLSRVGNQLTSKEVVHSSCKSESEQYGSAVTVAENVAEQVDKKSSTQRREDFSHPESAVTKESRKSDGSESKPGAEQSSERHRSSSDNSSTHSRRRHHHRHSSQQLHDKPGTEHMSQNEVQIVPPLKIRVEHHRHNKNVNPQPAEAVYSVNSCGSDKVSDDLDVLKKTADTENSVMVPISEPTTHVTDTRTEKGTIVLDYDGVSKKVDTRVNFDQRRTRRHVKPYPVVTKRRLSFEESLIAGTCISTTSTAAITTDSMKTSTTVSLMIGSETAHSMKDTTQTVAKPTAVTKAAFAPSIAEKRECTSHSTKKVKLEDTSSVPPRQLSSTKETSDEVEVKQKFSDTARADSKLVKSSSSAIPVPKESESCSSAAPPSEIKCDQKSNVTPVVTTEPEVGVKNSIVGAGFVTEAKESAQVNSAKHSSSDRTSCHHRHHDHRHSSSSIKPHRMAGSHVDYELRQSRHSGSKFSALIHIETDPNGGASVVHAYEDELSVLSNHELSEFVPEFFRIVFDEDPVGVPRHVMGIVHNSAAYLPDILEYFASTHPDMIVKQNHLGRCSDVETTTIGEYFQLVQSTYLAGTYRTGPLNHFSIVGTKAEETGGYFPEFLDLLDQNVFLKYVAPWGKSSELENMPRNQSNDGPIVWSRPGEQVVPTADMPKSPQVKKR